MDALRELRASGMVLAILAPAGLAFVSGMKFADGNAWVGGWFAFAALTSAIGSTFRARGLQHREASRELRSLRSK